MGFFSNLFSPRKPVIAKPRPDNILALESEVKGLKKKNEALESLLSITPDPDQNLPGNQAQSLFRSISRVGGVKDESDRDFDEAFRSRALAMTHKLYALRGSVYNIIEIFVDFIVGDDLIPKAKRKTQEGKDSEADKLQEELDEIWKDPRNMLYLKSENYIRTLVLEGELHLAADMSTVDGHLELGYVGLENIKKVVKNQRGVDIWIEMDNPKTPGQPYRYFVLNSITDTVKIEKNDDGSYQIIEDELDASGDTVNRRVAVADGLIFSIFNARPDGATRGRSEVLPILDYCDLHDELVWTQVEREKLLKLFIMDIEAKDVQNKAQAEAKLVELGLMHAPENPRVLIHNDKVKVNMLSPESSGRPTQNLEQILRHNIYGAKGLPEHWSGSGGGTNFATARAQDEVPLKRLRRKQKQIVNYFTQILKVSLMLKKQMGNSSIPENPQLDMTFLEVGGRDKQRGSTILKDLVVATSTALSDRVITREAANQILQQAIREAGFAVDPEHHGLPPEEDPVMARARSNIAAMQMGPFQQRTNRGEDQTDPQNEPGERRASARV